MNTRSNPSQSISKAKRMFLLNLALCSLLAAGFIVHHLGSSPETETAEPAETSAEQEPQSALELANRMGQAHGLSEDPRIYQPLKRERLLKKAKEVIERIEQSPEVTIDSDRETLITAYMDGYHARFEEHYSDRDGYEAGYQYGLKCDPTIYPMRSEGFIQGRLNHSKSIAMKKYSLDAIQWIVFKQGAIKGYHSGYMKTKEGITLKVMHDVLIIEP